LGPGIGQPVNRAALVKAVYAQGCADWRAHVDAAIALEERRCMIALATSVADDRQCSTADGASRCCATLRDAPIVSNSNCKYQIVCTPVAIEI
jgi:hypothetical protein